MKIYISTLLIFFNFYLTVSQNTKKIEYGLLFNLEEINDEKMKNSFLLKTINETKDDIKFELIFNDTVSFFKTKEQLNIPNKSKIFLASNMVIEGEYFFNRSSLILLHRISDVSYIVSNKLNWILHNEEKMIDNIKCYKATSEKTVINSKGKFVFPIIAWYAPDLPYSFGPGMFVGLPGLVLEVRDRNFVIFAKNIDLKSNEKIKEISIHKAIAEDVYLKRILNKN